MQATWLVNADAETRDAARAHMDRQSDRHPALAAHGPLTATDGWDESFERGLNWLLDGIEATAAAG